MALHALLWEAVNIPVGSTCVSASLSSACEDYPSCRFRLIRSRFTMRQTSCASNSQGRVQVGYPLPQGQIQLSKIPCTGTTSHPSCFPGFPCTSSPKAFIRNAFPSSTAHPSGYGNPRSRRYPRVYPKKSTKGIVPLCTGKRVLTRLLHDFRSHASPNSRPITPQTHRVGHIASPVVMCPVCVKPHGGTLQELADSVVKDQWDRSPLPVCRFMRPPDAACSCKRPAKPVLSRKVLKTKRFERNALKVKIADPAKNTGKIYQGENPANRPETTALLTASASARRSYVARTHTHTHTCGYAPRRAHTCA